MAAALLCVACSPVDDEQLSTPTEQKDGIVLNITSGYGLTRAGETTYEGNVEYLVNHLDVIVFNTETEANEAHERIDLESTDAAFYKERAGIMMRMRREQFTPGESYYIYVIANSTADSEEFDTDNLPDLSTLKGKKQKDPLIFLTGFDATLNGTKAPQSFLMDGIAFTGTSEPSTLADKKIVLNEENTSEKLELSVNLKRAAAKIVATIKEGVDEKNNNAPYVQFAKSSTTEDGITENGIMVYAVRNMPYDTSLLQEIELQQPEDGVLLNNRTSETAAYYQWTTDENNKTTVTVTAYVYSHVWESASAFESQTCLIVGIPLYDLRDGKTAIDGNYHANNYYRIPVSKSKKLDRNTCYMVNAAISAPGASQLDNSYNLEEIEYAVYKWGMGDDDNFIPIPIGGENKASYLSLNTNEMEMHNMDTDATTLYFASSSPVTARVISASYENKYGQTVNLQTTDAALFNQITATPAEGLNGEIKIYSPKPENNAIRTIVVEVENEDGKKDTVTIQQYPLEYITNIQGWYSYRTDFEGTTYEMINNTSVSGDSYYSGTQRKNSRYVAANWNNGTWTRDNTGGSNDFFFTSKVATENTDGTSVIAYYKWEESYPSWGTRYYTYTKSTSSLKTLTNARMYHVIISSTSAKYTIGIPHKKEIKEGNDSYEITDDDSNNAKLVSPSFLIASQLGATFKPTSAQQASSHCAKYIETYKGADGKAIALTGWRLPTRAEIEVIINFQYATNAAMDEVLNGKYYYCADGGTVYNSNSKADNDNPAVRCIRDAFDLPDKINQ